MEANITLATNARQVDAWLAAIPAGDPVFGARRLAAFLAGHDRNDVGRDLRLHLFEAARPLIRGLCDDLYSRSPDGVDDRRALLTAARAFCARLILEQAPSALAARERLAGLIGPYFDLARDTMSVCHGRHWSLPKGYWLDTHAVARLVAGENSPVFLSYMKLLLEAAADPYRLSEHEYRVARAVIGHDGHLAQLSPARDLDHAGVFCVRAYEDRAFRLMSWDDGTARRCDLILDTTRLVRRLALILAQATDFAADARVHSLLGRLKQNWSGAAQRRTLRHASTRTGGQRVTIGYEAVLERMRGGSGQGALSMPCRLINESPGGVAVHIADARGDFRVGSLVALVWGDAGVRDDIGLVSWYKVGDDASLAFGLKFLSGRLYSAQAGMSGSACLCVESGIGQTARLRLLLMPVSSPAPSGSLEVRYSGVARMVKILARVEQTSEEVALYRCVPAA